MKKLVLFLFIFTAGSIFAQADKIVGDWLLTNVVINGKTKDVYNTFSFKKDGSMETMGILLGTWKYNPSDGTILFNSKFSKKFNGKAKIVKAGDDVLEMKKDGTIIHYLKLDGKKILENNRNSGIVGTWQQDNEGKQTFIKFDLPETFTAVTTGDGSVETINGTWLYFPENSTLVISAISTRFRGKNIVKKLTDKELTIETNEGEVAAAKVLESPVIDSLNFTVDDLPEEENLSALPWRDFGEMVEKLSGVKFLRYRYGEFLPKVNNFVYTEWINRIKVNPEKPSVEFTGLQILGADTSQFSQKYKDNLQESYNLFFPMPEYYRFRITGHEKIKVPAGQFNCTVVEAADGDDKFKLWMIDDLPGVYAKIIKVTNPSFSGKSYTVQELEEIHK